MTAPSFPWRQLGEILVRDGLLTEDELERALREQQRSGRLLGQILVQHGHVSSFALARALNAAGQQHKVALLEISIDPHRDTPARLRAYQKLFGAARSNWTLLRAAPADTARLW